ncbi:MAG: hypothetical protein A2953_00160 [Candidatus Levybacteria bacterium RIFCSPLOWO2_01_FULL_36_54]|nr:MAG: hypothetical protein A2953_00160 [Candidatus Levybacteria bacterium RIFCSPLOWO2_01_FULL_36_54]
MISSIVADSSALVSLALSTDSNHKQAVLLARQIEKNNKTLILPGEIFAEIINILGKKVSKEIAVFTANKILKSDLFQIIESSNAQRLSALEKFQKQPRSVSFTDCVVMASADHFDTKDIFGFDEIFKKNGYVRLGIDKRT